MRIVVVNRSTHVKATEAVAMLNAVSRQLVRHFCPAWGLAVPSLVYVPTGSEVPAGSHVVTIADSDGGGEDYLGYHSEESGGKYYAVVFAEPVLDNKGVVLFDKKVPQNTSVASVLSHEVLEMLVDPYVNLWCEGPEIAAGNQYAFEVCDPVEGGSYVVDGGTGKLPVSVSNFVFPEWFDALAKTGGRFDQLARLSRPFSMDAGGYMVVRSGEKSSEVFGETYPAWRRAGKQRATSRAARLRAGVKIADAADTAP